MDDVVEDIVLTEGDNTVYFILSEVRSSIHEIATFCLAEKVYQKDEFNRELIKKIFHDNAEWTLLGMFTDLSDAESFHRFVINIASLEYTMILNKLDNLDCVNTRPFVVYLSDEVTYRPGLYRIRKADYDKLRTKYDIRLATDEEILAMPAIFSCFVPRDFDLISSLRLTNLRGFQMDTNASPSELEQICEQFDITISIWNHLNASAIRLAKGWGGISREQMVKTAARISPKSPEELVDNLIDMYADINAGRDTKGFFFSLNFFTSQGNTFKVDYLL